jgi:hypothetical protein
MAAIPDATLTVTDGALGAIEPEDASSATIGSCSAGTINTLYAFTDTKDLSDTLGTGPAVEAAAHKLSIGGGTVFVVRVDNTSTPGTNGSVTHNGTGVSVMSVSGAPFDAYKVRVTIVLGGTNPAAGTATFKYSVDGGDNYSGEIALPTSGSYPITGTGLTLAFTAASLVAADTYSFDSVAPGYNSTELTTAWNALVADPRTWKFCHITGAASSAANQATIATAVGALLTTAETNYRFTYAILEMPDLGDGTTGDAASIAAYASFAHSRIMQCAGFCELTSIVSGRIHKRSAAWPIAARRHKAPISESSMRVKSGSLPGVVSLYRDELLHRGLDAARFATLRTHVGRAGFWITEGKMMAAQGSDYGLVQRREVMDRACTIGRSAMVEELGDGLRVNPANAASRPGMIDERDARAIESEILAKVAEAVLAVGALLRSLGATVNRTDNIISSNLVRAKIRVLPKAYANNMSADIGFENPALDIQGQ